VLTGLYNRRKFSENLQREVIRSNRLKTPLTMLYIDVDDFKSINDTHGHTEGDLVLRNVANMLLETGRHQLDTFYRLGGDEFAAVLPGASEEDAAGIIQRAEQNCRQNHDYLQQLNVSLSFGIAALEEGESADQLIKRADDKMYTSKSKRSSVGEHSSVMILRPDSSTSVSVKTHH
jgi:diguanylate cyclase (GGDEF)-like protein